MTVVVHLELLILVILICWFGDWICKWQLNVCCYNTNVCDIRCLFVPEHHIVRYDFRMKTMFGSSLPQVVYRRSHVLFTFCVLACVWWCPTNVVFCFSFVFLRLCCQFFLIVLSWLTLRYYLTFMYCLKLYSVVLLTEITSVR